MSNKSQPLSEEKNRSSPYDTMFYESNEEGMLRSAQVVVPLVMDLVQPRSVVDVGCGRGAWLSVFRDHGVKRLRGLDGPWVERDKLLIDQTFFSEADLCKRMPLCERFDLAVCLEVGEHLPHSVAPQLVQSLTEFAPVVLFSAAVPGQGGTAHINEQWPDYWAALFDDRSYRRLDPFRRHVLHDESVSWWYRQNISLYVQKGAVESSPALRAEEEHVRRNPFEYVTADILARHKSFRGLLGETARAAWRAVRRVVER